MNKLELMKMANEIRKGAVTAVYHATETVLSYRKVTQHRDIMRHLQTEDSSR